MLKNSDRREVVLGRDSLFRIREALYGRGNIPDGIYRSNDDRAGAVADKECGNDSLLVKMAFALIGSPAIVMDSVPLDEVRYVYLTPAVEQRERAVVSRATVAGLEEVARVVAAEGLNFDEEMALIHEWVPYREGRVRYAWNDFLALVMAGLMSTADFDEEVDECLNAISLIEFVN